MFLLIESTDPTKWCAVISQDNMVIQWDKGIDGAWTEPPWNKLYMPEYDKEFQAARRSYNMSEVNLRKLGPVETHPVENPGLF